MRTPIIAGNWKMNKTIGEARQLVSELLPDLALVAGVEKVFCPPFTALASVHDLVLGAGVGLGAQNLYWEPKGAYTGEISPVMLAELCQYVIIGHSERRTYFGETDATVNRKAHAALAHGLTPIICVGETLQENQAGQTADVVTRQVRAALAGFEPGQVAHFVIAYEPVWAIGTGLAATGEGANAVIANYVRGPISEMYGVETAQAVRVQYGGSVTAANAAEFFGQPDIDGALVGGASLKAPDFLGIVRAAALYG